MFLLPCATSTLAVPRNDVLISVMLAAVILAVLLLVVGRFADSWTPRRTYALDAGLYALSVYLAFRVFRTRDPLPIRLVVVLALGVVHAILYAPQGTLHAQLSPVRMR